MSLVSIISSARHNYDANIIYHLITNTSCTKIYSKLLHKVRYFSEINGINLMLYNLDHFIVDNKSVRAVSRMPPALWRLVIPEIIESDYIMYLDNDTFANGQFIDLSPTFSTNYTILARVDSACKCKYFLKYKECDGISPEAPYFNSGVMLWDLTSSRKNNDVQKLIKTALENWHECFTTPFPQGDQLVLNIVYHERWKELDVKYNYFVRDPDVEDARIVHYIGDTKPWGPRTQRSYCFKYWLDLLKTPYPFWRFSDFAKRLLFQGVHEP